MLLGFPAVNVLPPTGIAYPMPAGQAWCDTCFAHTHVVPLSDPTQGWHCEYSFECDHCFNDQHYLCPNCEHCEDCCECVYCEGCGDRYHSDDVCTNCYACSDCCECQECGSCERRYASNVYICSDCDRCERCECECESEEEEDDSDSYHVHAISENGAGKQLVGIEIEFAGNRSLISEQINAVRSLVGWKVVSDGSIYDGGELVSPPLDWHSDDAQEQLITATNVLRQYGASTSPRAGIHVHVDARTMTAQQVSKAAVWAYEWEDQLFRVASSGWRTIRAGGISNYCAPISHRLATELDQVTDNASFARAWYGTSAPRRDHYDSSRYAAVNLHSWTYRGTVEFRVFNSSLNPARIAAYVDLCVAVMDSARDGKTPKPAVRYALGMMADQSLNHDDAFQALVSGLWQYMSYPQRQRLAWVWETSHAQVA